MKILLLSNKFPYPPNDGGAIATLRIIEGLSKNGCSLDVLSLNTKKHYFDIRKLPIEVSSWANFKSVDINTDVTVLGALKGLFQKESYHLTRFNSKEYKATLIECLQNNNYDIIHLEGLHISIYLPIIRKYSQAKVVLRAHNIEHIIWERLCKETRNPIKKAYLQILTKKLKRYEIEVLNKFDAIIPITDIDKKLFIDLGFKWEMCTIPTGIDMESYKSYQDIAQTADNIFHLGSLDWLPNQQGIDWFLESVLPLILNKKPTFKFFLAGRVIPTQYKDKASNNLIIEENIPNAKEYMQHKGIMICPLLSGSGMRIKILEGLALGKAIVSTTIGAEGISVTHQKDILIADTPQEFANSILQLLNDNNLRNQISHNAIHLAVSQYDNQSITKQLVSFFQRLVSLY